MGKRQTEGTGNGNEALVDMLNELADHEKNITGNIHKYKAYRKAAEVLAKHHDKIKSGEEAKKLPGIGERIGAKIDEFLSTGKLKKLEEIKKNFKFRAIKILTKVSGIGPVKARELVKRGIYTIEDLKKVKHELTHQQKIGLKYFYDFELKIPRNEVAEIEQKLIQEFQKMSENYVVTICGSYRRGKPSSNDVDCLVTHPQYVSKKCDRLMQKSQFSLEKSIDKLRSCGLVIETIALGPTKFMGVCRMRNKPARRLDIRMTFYDQYYCSVLYFTGSDLFNQSMRAHAHEHGFILNEYYLRPIGVNGVPGQPLPVTCEKDIFDYILYPYKPPEERNL